MAETSPWPRERSVTDSPAELQRRVTSPQRAPAERRSTTIADRAVRPGESADEGRARSVGLLQQSPHDLVTQAGGRALWGARLAGSQVRLEGLRGHRPVV